jgi:hypothetical protein
MVINTTLFPEPVFTYQMSSLMSGVLNKENIFITEKKDMYQKLIV